MVVVDGLPVDAESVSNAEDVMCVAAGPSIAACCSEREWATAEEAPVVDPTSVMTENTHSLSLVAYLQKHTAGLRHDAVAFVPLSSAAVVAAAEPVDAALVAVVAAVNAEHYEQVTVRGSGDEVVEGSSVD